MDMCRGSLECQSMQVMAQGLAYLACHPMIWILRTKMRFADNQATTGGWRDVLVNIASRDDAELHICEIQFVHCMLMRVRADMGAHRDYSTYRAAIELLEWYDLCDASVMTEARGHSQPSDDTSPHW